MSKRSATEANISKLSTSDFYGATSVEERVKRAQLDRQVKAVAQAELPIPAIANVRQRRPASFKALSSVDYLAAPLYDGYLFPEFPRQDAAFAYADAINSGEMLPVQSQSQTRVTACKLLNHKDLICADSDFEPKIYPSTAFVPSYQRVRVIASEFASGSGSGARKYLVASLPEFWMEYQLMKPSDRSFYEVLREHEPCHLYFDLEYNIALNRKSDGDAMVQYFITRLTKELFEKYQLTLRPEAIVHLCSSSVKKFSRHLICHLPNCLFADSVQCGYFVRRFCAALELEARSADQKQSEAAGAESLLVFTDETNLLKRSLFVDSGVYTKNRLFRMYLSSKRQKNTFLSRAGENKFETESDSEFFFASLASNALVPVKYQLPTHSPEEILLEYTAACWPDSELVVREAGTGSTAVNDDSVDCEKPVDGGISSASTAQMWPTKVTLLTAPPFDCFDARRYQPIDAAKEAHRLALARQHIGSGYSISAGSSVKSQAFSHEHPHSPYPALDQFVADFVASWGDGHLGYLKSWMMFEDNKAMCYHVGGTRYCSNIGRQHKSNQIFFVADFKHQVVYQKCWDPECRNYRSGSIVIPPHIADLLDPAFVAAMCELDDTSLDSAAIDLNDSIPQSSGNDTSMTSAVVSSQTMCPDEIASLESAMLEFAQQFPDW